MAADNAKSTTAPPVGSSLTSSPPQNSNGPQAKALGWLKPFIKGNKQEKGMHRFSYFVEHSEDLEMDMEPGVEMDHQVLSASRPDLSPDTSTSPYESVLDLPNLSFASLSVGESLAPPSPSVSTAASLDLLSRVPSEHLETPPPQKSRRSSIFRRPRLLSRAGSESAAFTYGSGLHIISNLDEPECPLHLTHTVAELQGEPGFVSSSFRDRVIQRLKNVFTVEPEPTPSIFNVPLQVSMNYAKCAISLTDENGKSYVYGYVPIVVAKCGVFLKARGM
jgi:hypothetical protein